MKANKKDPTDGEEEAQSILKMDLASFDLENVFALPRNTVSSAFYKRKLNTFIFTALEARSKQTHIVIWIKQQLGALQMIWLVLIHTCSRK